MQVADPRHSSYIEYNSMVILVTLYYKGSAGISSMQEMTRQFNNKTVTKNLYCFMYSDAKNYLPHGITVNEFPEKSDPDEPDKYRKTYILFQVSQLLIPISLLEYAQKE